MLTALLVAFSLCFAFERIVPGWCLPKVRDWPVRALLLNGIQLAIILMAGSIWQRWFAAHSLLHLSAHMPVFAGALIAYLCDTFIFYWWHRWRHENDLLWRVFHQIHHSPQRLELITSFYKHPLEMLIDALLGCTLVYGLLGLSPAAVAMYTLFAALGQFFYHASILTPRWVGYFFQRPEMHRIHHEFRRHRNNYGDITWWDMLFGTYENPKSWQGRCGFEESRELQLGRMLAMQDVHADELHRATALACEDQRS